MILRMMKRAAMALAISSALAQPAMAADDTIKVGLILIDSGPFASNYGIGDAARLAVDMFNEAGGALGKKFELSIQTHAGTPAGALAATTRAVQQDGASFITGMLLSPMVLAINPRLASLNALLIDSNTQLDSLIGKNCNPNYFRVSAGEGMLLNVFRSYLKNSDAKSWNTLALDLTAGHEFAKGFSASVEQNGGSVGLNLFTPLGTADFGTQISQLANKPADGLAVMIVGNDVITLAKQQQQFGLFKGYKTVLSNGFTNDIVLKAQGESVLGVTGTTGYFNTLDTPRNAAFVKAFEARHQRKPNPMEADMYVGLEMLQAAIGKAQSAEVGAVRSALEGLKTETIYGDVEMRAQDHQLLRQVLMAQVVKADDGSLTFAVRENFAGADITPAVNPECKR